MNLDILLARFSAPSTFLFQRNISRDVSSLRFGTRLHGGYSSADFDVKGRWISSWDWYDRRLLYRVQIVGNGWFPVWEGRIEDIELIPGGVHITALGFYSHTKDRIYGLPWPAVAQTNVEVARVGSNYLEVDWDDTQIQTGESWTVDQFVTDPPSYYVVVESGGTDGTVTGATWDADDPWSSATKYSLLFDNASEKLAIVPPAQGNRWNFAPTTDFTVECWLKVTAWPTDLGLDDATEATIVTNEVQGGANDLIGPRSFFRLNIRSDGRLAAYISDGREIGIGEGTAWTPHALCTYVTGTGTVSTGAWHRVALVVSRAFSRVRLYLDGTFYGDATPSTLQSGIYTSEPIRVANDGAGTASVVYYTQAFTKRSIRIVSLGCRVHGLRLSNCDRWLRNELLPAGADPPPDAFTVLLLYLNDNSGTAPLDSSRPGDGGSGEANTTITDNTVNRLTIQGAWESSLIPGDTVVIGHRATQDDIITDALSLCPLISTDYTDIDPDTALSLDVTPQDFSNGETVQDVIEHLCQYGSGDADLNPVYFAVWDDRRPSLKPYNTDTVTWQVRMSDIGGERDLALTRSIKTLANKTFTYYNDEEGEQQATDWFPDDHLLDMDETLRDDAVESQAEFGTFERSVSIGQAFLADADQFAQQLLSDELLPDQASSLSLTGTIGGPAGARHFLWEVRAGDVVEIVDLLDAELPISNKVARKLRRFIVKETEYEVDSNRLTLTPEGEVATVEMLLAIAQIGSQRV